MRKYSILIASVFIQICLGASYSWSSFIPALKEHYGITITQSQAIFSAITISLTTIIAIGGRIQDKLGPRIPTVMGGVLLGAGYLFAGLSNGSFLFLFLFIGIMSGIGVGMAYIAPIACSMKWFPNHKSLVTGIAVAGFGGSPIVISQISEYLMAANIDVLAIFKYLGIGFVLVVVSFAFFLGDPRKNQEQSITTRYSTIKILKDRHFWVLVSGILPCECIGLIIIGNMKPFGISMNVDYLVAGFAVGLFGIFNAIGRVSWGGLGGLLSSKRVIVISLISTCLVCLCAPIMAMNNYTFQLFAILTGFNHGGCMVLYAADVAQHYGVERVGSIYSLLFVSNAFASVIGPVLAGRIYDSMGSYTPVFIIWGIISLICILLFNNYYREKEEITSIINENAN